MNRLTPTSWVKIALIILLCLVLCAGVSGCFAAMQRSVNAAVGIALRHHDAIDDASAFPDGGDASFATADVRDIAIDWLAGEVEVVATDDAACGGMIELQETMSGGGGEVSERERMRWRLEDGRLTIAYGTGDYIGWGVHGCSAAGSKSLTVLVPSSYAHELGALSISAASGSYRLTGIGCERLDIDLASGEVSGTGLSAKTLEANVASGRVDLQGAFSERMTLDIMSGNVDIACADAWPRTADIDLASGNLQILTPSESGYTANVDKLSGNFTCPRGQQNGSVYVVGDGSAAYAVDIASGNVTLD